MNASGEFMAPENLKYAKNHEWVKSETDGTVTIFSMPQRTGSLPNPKSADEPQARKQPPHI